MNTEGPSVREGENFAPVKKNCLLHVGGRVGGI